jgi:hypothetical protein
MPGMGIGPLHLLSATVVVPLLFGNRLPKVMRSLGRKQSSLNPNFCNVCEDFAKKFPGGAEVEMAMLFADVRGSTSLSEQMTAIEFQKLINRFYVGATHEIAQEDVIVAMDGKSEELSESEFLVALRLEHGPNEAVKFTVLRGNFGRPHLQVFKDGMLAHVPKPWCGPASPAIDGCAPRQRTFSAVAHSRA